VACRLLAETNVVERAVPFQATLDEEMKLVPDAVMVTAADPAAAEFGLTDVSAGAGFWVLVPEAPFPPQPGRTQTKPPSRSQLLDNPFMETSTD
jgi:hypothetical protein